MLQEKCKSQTTAYQFAVHRQVEYRWNAVAALTVFKFAKLFKEVLILLFTNSQHNINITLTKFGISAISVFEM